MDRSSETRKQLTSIRPGIQGVMFGVFVGALLVAADQASVRFGLSGSQRIADDICGGIIAGLAVFWYARIRTQYIAQRLNTIALMNHHVRNALQVIKYSGYIKPETEQMARLDEAVQRIEWALREVLPGHVVDSDQDWKQPSVGDGVGTSSGAV